MNYGHGGVVTSRTISSQALHITTFTNSISKFKSDPKNGSLFALLSDSKIYTLNNMHYTSLKILL